jgi:hypothetical protein
MVNLLLVVQFEHFDGASVLASRLVCSLAPPNQTTANLFVPLTKFVRANIVRA